MMFVKQLISLITIISAISIINSNGATYNNCVNNKHLSLTFDDGPSTNTRNLVNILNKYNISGTFFINGIYVIRNNYQSLIKEMYNQKHLIASHGFSHGAMEKINYFSQLRELYDNELIFRQVLNIRPLYYRPPYFSYDASIINIINSFGYHIITSNLNTNDWNATTSTEIYNNFINILTKNNGGGIILQHDYQVLNNEALIKMIDYAILKGYKFVPLNTCIGLNQLYTDDNKYGPQLLNGI